MESFSVWIKYFQTFSHKPRNDDEIYDHDDDGDGTDDYNHGDEIYHDANDANDADDANDDHDDDEIDHDDDANEDDEMFFQEVVCELNGCLTKELENYRLSQQLLHP